MLWLQLSEVKEEIEGEGEATGGDSSSENSAIESSVSEYREA